MGRSGSDIFRWFLGGGEKDAGPGLYQEVGFFLVIIIWLQGREFSIRAIGDSSRLELPSLLFCSDFVSAARTATSRATRHLDFSRYPVDVRVVFPQARVSHDYVF